MCIRNSFPFKAKSYSILCTPHFAYPFIQQETLRLFHLSATENSAAMNIGVQICVCVCFQLLCVYLEVDLLDHIAFLCLSSLRNCSKYFHRGCNIFTLPPAKYKGLNLAITLSILVIFCLFKSSYLMGMKWYLVFFYLYFPSDL